jgi:hypothetical protein
VSRETFLRYLKNRSDTIISLIQSVIGSRRTENNFFEPRLKVVNEEYGKIKDIMARYFTAAIRESYTAGEKSAKKAVGSRVAAALRASGKQEQVIQLFTREVLLDTFTALDAGARDTERLFRLTQQYNIEEAKINQALKAGLETDNTPRAVKSELLKTLEERVGKDGKIITVNSATGTTRRYHPEAYADMVARTRVREAQSMAMKNSLLELGHDLVRVSDHDTETEICLEYEGLVFSLTGATAGYDELDQLPPFHPNCFHTLAPFFEAKTDARREAQQESLQEQEERNERKLAELNA